MSENDGIRCPNCGTVATENTWHVNEGKCLNCGYVILLNSEEPQNVTYSGIFGQKPAMTSSQNQQSNPDDVPIFTSMERGTHSFPWRLLISVLVLAGILCAAMFAVDTLFKKSPATFSQTRGTEVSVDIATLSEETPAAQSPQVFIEGGIPEKQQTPATITLKHIWSGDEKMDRVILIFLIVFLIVVIVVGFLDAKRSIQMSDAVISLLVVAAYLILGLPIIRDWMLSHTTIMWCTIVGCFCILLGAVFSGKFDMTPVAMLLTALAVVSIAFNYGGIIQAAVHVPSGLLLTFGSLWQVYKYGLFATISVKFTLFVDVILLIAQLISFIENIRPTKKGKHISIHNFFGVFYAYITVGIFLILSATIKVSWPAWVLPVVMMLVVLLVDFLLASIFREQMDGYGNNYTQYVFGRLRIAAPYDVIMYQLLLAVFLMIQFGTI